MTNAAMTIATTPAISGSAGSKVAKEELLELLAQALAELPEDWQEVLAGHYVHGLKVAQIAAELGRTRPSVAGVIRRGQDVLAEQIHLQGEDAEQQVAIGFRSGR